MGILIVDRFDGDDPEYIPIAELSDHKLRQLALMGSKEAVEVLVKRHKAERERTD